MQESSRKLLKSLLQEAAIKNLSQEKKLINPADVKHLRKAMGGVKNQSDHDVITYAEEECQRFLKALANNKKSTLPVSFNGGSYVYTVVDVNPLKVTSSDGEVLKDVKYLSDIGRYLDRGHDEDFYAVITDQYADQYSANDLDDVIKPSAKR